MENVKSGYKSGSGIPGKKFRFFSSFNCEHFLLITFFKKMVLGAKKVCFFCIFHVLQFPPGNRRTDIGLFGNKINKMAESLTARKTAQFFFRGKKPDPEIPGKIRVSNFWHFYQILRMGSINYVYMEKYRNSFEILTIYDEFNITISALICTNSWLIGNIYIF